MPQTSGSCSVLSAERCRGSPSPALAPEGLTHPARRWRRPPIRQDLIMDAKTKLLIAAIVLAAVAGLVLSALLAFTSTPAN